MRQFFFRHAVKGGALIITLVVAMLLAILCTSLLLLFYYNRSWERDVQINNRLKRNVYSGINLMLSDTSFDPHTSADSMDLFDRNEDAVIFEKEPWGLYNFAKVTARLGDRSVSKLMLYGSKPQSTYDNCVYLADHGITLSLIGNVRLAGDLFVPGAELKPGYINQRGFSRNKMAEGTVFKSLQFLPSLNHTVLANLTSLIDSALQSNTQNQNGWFADTVVRSFSEAELTYRRHGVITLEKKDLRGRICIMSDTLIEVKNSAILENVLLVAPVIKFNRGFIGTVQAIAANSIITEDSTIFKYPSSFTVLKKRASGFSGIKLGDHGNFQGCIVSVSDSLDKEKTIVEVGRNCHVMGLLYVRGYLATLSDISGSVATEYFLYKNNASVLLNTIVDISIDRPALPDYFIASLAFGSSKKEIMTWLH